MIGITLSYDGSTAEDHEINLYDTSQAMLGFQRSIALTTHLVLNGNVIIQAPALKGAKIITTPPEEGSYKIPAYITAIAIAGYSLGTAPKDTPLGNIMYSAYDYIISESLGFHVDYDNTLGLQYQELKKSQQNAFPILEQSQFDSVIEKCDGAIIGMHRPIFKSGSATSASLSFTYGGNKTPFGRTLNEDTYSYMSETNRDEVPVQITCRISSYNINTFKGRAYVTEENRPIPFELDDFARSPKTVAKITHSLQVNAVDRFIEDADLKCMAYRNLSRSGRLKSYYIIEVL